MGPPPQPSSFPYYIPPMLHPGGNPGGERQFTPPPHSARRLAAAHTPNPTSPGPTLTPPTCLYHASPSSPSLSDLLGSTMWKRWFTAPPHDDDSTASCALDGTCKLPAASSSASPSPSRPVTSAAGQQQQQHLSSSSVGPKKGTWSGYFFGK